MLFSTIITNNLLLINYMEEVKVLKVSVFEYDCTPYTYSCGQNNKSAST